MIKEKMEQARRLLDLLQTQISSNEVKDLVAHEKTLEELSACMQEIFASSDVEKSEHRDEFISLSASVAMCLEKLGQIRNDSRSHMQKLMQNMKLQKSYGKK